MGVRYELRLTKKRSLRRSLVGSSRTDEQGNFWALREINLRVEPGESVAVIGHPYKIPIHFNWLATTPCQLNIGSNHRRVITIFKMRNGMLRIISKLRELFHVIH